MNNERRMMNHEVGDNSKFGVGHSKFGIQKKLNNE